MMLDLPGEPPAYAYTGGRPFDPGLPCVVLLHGALNDHSVWTLMARWLAHHGHAVLALDLPGHGRSPGPLAPDLGALADWAWRCADAAGAAQAVVAGHSMGSLVALEMAARQPARARALALFATAYPMKVSDALLQAAAEDPEAGMDRVNAFSLSTWAAKPSCPGPGTWLHGAGRQLMAHVQRRSGGAAFLHDFRLCNAYAGGEAAASAVRCPSHVVVAQGDQMTTPRQSSGLVQALRAQVHPVPGGHAMLQEQPDACLQAMRSVLGA